jgi:4-amino-4-deoxy-L-arabinose transferase-like glycosyltransferase
MIAKHRNRPAKSNSQTANFEKIQNSRKRNNYWPWIILALTILFAAVIRIRLLQIPLERDEGGFAYIGQLILQGIPPYLLAYSMQLPGLYAAYALIMAIFGQTITGIHLGLILVNSAAVFLLFLLTRRLFDDIAAIVAAVCYALLSLSPSVLGTSAHATQFIVPLVLGGTILLLRALDSGKTSMLLVSGFLFGLAFIMKQHAIFLSAFALFYFTMHVINMWPIDWKRLVAGNIIFIIGMVLPFLITCAILYNAGVFSKFWFWTFTYASQYVSEILLSAAIQNFKVAAPKAIAPWFWTVAGVGITAIFWNEKAKLNWLFLLGFTLFSFLAICPGFYFREHYFIT